jgi:hypothetical protein
MHVPTHSLKMNTITWYALDAIANYLTPGDQMRHAMTGKGMMSAYLWAERVEKGGHPNIGVGSTNPQARVRYAVMLNSLKLDCPRRYFCHSLQDTLDVVLRPVADTQIAVYDRQCPSDSSSWSDFARKHLRARPGEKGRRNPFSKSLKRKEPEE